MKMNLKKGDKVIALAGKDKGKTALIERVFAKNGKLIAAKLNTVKKHVKVSKKYPSGGTVEVSQPMPAGKVQLVCPSCNKPTRIGYMVKGKEKTRICKKCGKAITVAKEKKEK